MKRLKKFKQDYIYAGMDIKFLEMMFGCEWKNVYVIGYNSDKKDLIKDYSLEYEDYLEFKKCSKN